MLKIIVDFNNLTPDGEQVLVARNKDTDIVSQLEAGMRVLLHERYDFEVEAIVEPVVVFKELIWWYGTPDWATRVDFDE